MLQCTVEQRLQCLLRGLLGRSVHAKARWIALHGQHDRVCCTVFCIPSVSFHALPELKQTLQSDCGNTLLAQPMWHSTARMQSVGWAVRAGPASVHTERFASISQILAKRWLEIL